MSEHARPGGDAGPLPSLPGGGPGLPVRVIVDVMNVMGATPDGWWRDRAGAARRLLARLADYAAREGVALTAVLDGRPLPDTPNTPEGAAGLVEVLYARRPGRDAADDRIVELVEEIARTSATRSPAAVLVVTSDRGLAARVRAHGAEVIGARTFLRRVDAP